MSKLLLGMSVVAFGALISVSGTHAALRVGSTSVMSLNPNVPSPRCSQCGVYSAPRPGDYSTPRPGDTNALNPQPLPPKISFYGRLPRR
jgi:hypothetical protein